MLLKEIPPGSGIHGRPILQDVQPGVRHLATWNDTRRKYVTWCDLEVPDNHMCPSREEVARGEPYVIQNCVTCHHRYLAHQRTVRINGASWLTATG